MISLPRDIFERLKNTVPFFFDFSDEELLTFLKLMKSEKFINEQIIFMELDPGDRMYIMLKGKVRISKRSGSEDTVLAHLESGECFGEMGMIDRQPRSATAVSEGDSFLFSMAATTINKISLNPRYSRLSSKLFRNFSLMLATRLRDLNQRYADLQWEHSPKKEKPVNR
ncbi:MAG: cyclic nucleotide-binding domain-containing protein [Proteobacteria bacterium]|nr:cyclic nucleotide-binding domain-containing protein [Pseudomonadota bacterium]